MYLLPEKVRLRYRNSKWCISTQDSNAALDVEARLVVLREMAARVIAENTKLKFPKMSLGMNDFAFLEKLKEWYAKETSTKELPKT